MTVQGASAATLAETLPSSERISESWRAPITMWSTWLLSANSSSAAAGSIASSTCTVRRPASTFSGCGPVTQPDHAVDLLIVALFVEGGIEADTARCLSTLRQASRADGMIVSMRAAVRRSASASATESSLEIDRDGDDRRGPRSAPRHRARRANGTGRC